MRYKIILANCDRVIDKHVDEVYKITEGSNAYFLRDVDMKVIFTAPFDSVICIELA